MANFQLAHPKWTRAASTDAFPPAQGKSVLDPTKIVRVALENAVSVASVLLLMEAMMTEIPEKKAVYRPEPETKF